MLIFSILVVTFELDFSIFWFVVFWYVFHSLGFVEVP